MSADLLNTEAASIIARIEVHRRELNLQPGRADPGGYLPTVGNRGQRHPPGIVGAVFIDDVYRRPGMAVAITEGLCRAAVAGSVRVAAIFTAGEGAFDVVPLFVEEK